MLDLESLEELEQQLHEMKEKRCKEVLKRNLPEVLFRYDDDWEHIIVYNKDGYNISDGVENHKLSALEVLTELDRCGIIKLSKEEIREDDKDD